MSQFVHVGFNKQIHRAHPVLKIGENNRPKSYFYLELKVFKKSSNIKVKTCSNKEMAVQKESCFNNL